MEKKVLGKIVSAEFGEVSDYPFLMGLLLEFSYNDEYGCRFGISSGAKLTVNMSEKCVWSSEEERRIAIQRQTDAIRKILDDAGVCTVSQLKGKPVEIVIQNDIFKSFRILTEVL